MYSALVVLQGGQSFCWFSMFSILGDRGDRCGCLTFWCRVVLARTNLVRMHVEALLERIQTWINGGGQKSRSNSGWTLLTWCMRVALMLDVIPPFNESSGLSLTWRDNMCWVSGGPWPQLCAPDSASCECFFTFPAFNLEGIVTAADTSHLVCSKLQKCFLWCKHALVEFVFGPTILCLRKKAQHFDLFARQAPPNACLFIGSIHVSVELWRSGWTGAPWLVLFGSKWVGISKRVAKAARFPTWLYLFKLFFDSKVVFKNRIIKSSLTIADQVGQAWAGFDSDFSIDLNWTVCLVCFSKKNFLPRSQQLRALMAFYRWCQGCPKCPGHPEHTPDTLQRVSTSNTQHNINIH